MSLEFECEQPAVQAGRIIVLDDEVRRLDTLQAFLTSEGFEVRTVGHSARLYRCIELERFDLLILNTTMQPDDGLSVYKRLRLAGRAIPTLMLAAGGSPVDRMNGLASGPDDLLAWPFLPDELMARIRAILRKKSMHGDQPIDRKSDLIFGRFYFDMALRQLTKDGSVVDLHTAEARLLAALAATPNRAVSRANLLDRARARDYGASGRSIDVRIRRLRQLLEDDPSRPRLVRTVRGLGYMLVAEVMT
jgi:two-component system, OmpR family, phosphate regulon response regulator OmpR